MLLVTDLRVGHPFDQPPHFILPRLPSPSAFHSILMRRDRIAFALWQHEEGTAVAEIIGKLGVSEQTFYRWKKKYAGLGIAELRRLKQPEEENRKLKQLVADLSLDKKMLQDVLSKNA
jgi:putative transposase